MKNQKNSNNQLGNSYFKVQEQLGIVRRELKIANERLEVADRKGKKYHDMHLKSKEQANRLERELKSVRRDLWLSLATVVLITLIVISGVVL